MMEFIDTTECVTDVERCFRRHQWASVSFSRSSALCIL